MLTDLILLTIGLYKKAAFLQDLIGYLKNAWFMIHANWMFIDASMCMIKKVVVLIKLVNRILADRRCRVNDFSLTRLRICGSCFFHDAL
jgi:hypothetical protein